MPYRRNQLGESNSISYLVPTGLFPETHTLAFNHSLSTLTLLYVSDGLPHIEEQQQFSETEALLLLPLMDAFPYHCPYEVLFAAHSYGNTQEPTVTKCRKLLEQAEEDGVWDDAMRPLRNVLSHTRVKLRAFHIGLSSIYETGYILVNKREKE